MNRLSVPILLLLLLRSQPVAAQLPSTTPDTRQIPRTIPHEVGSPAQIQRLQKSGRFQPVLRDEFFRLLQQREDRIAATESAVDMAEYSATLSRTMQLEGTLSLHLDDTRSPKSRERFVSIGRANLQELQLFSGASNLELSTDSLGSIVVPGNITTGKLSGRWKFQGTPMGASTVFQLQLPAASICKLIIQTSSDILLSSSNALVSSRRGENGKIQWTLYPTTATAVSISCTARSENLSRENAGVAVKTDCRFYKYGGQGTWTVSVPQSLTDTILQFVFTHPCDVGLVTLPGDTSLRWEKLEGKPSEAIRVWVPPGETGVTFSIAAHIQPQADAVDIPLLVPDSWQPALTEIGRPLQLRTSSVRAMISPEFVVTEVDAVGISEEQVQYGPDNSQIMVLSQFSQKAHVRLKTVPSTPVVEDSIVLLQSTDEGRAEALVQVTARSGIVGALAWDIPASWGVTEVTEAGSDISLLFRLSDSGRNGISSRLSVTLRTPLAAGGTQAVQGLRIQLQSTRGQMQRELPELQNSEYQRRNDYFVPSALNSRIRKLAGKQGVSLETLHRDLLTWLPVDEADDRLAFERTDILLVTEADTVDQDSVVAGDSMARASESETISVSRQSTDEVPKNRLDSIDESAPLRVSGNAYAIASDSVDGLVVEANYRLAVTSSATTHQLKMRCRRLDSMKIYVDGREVYAEQAGDEYFIPLSKANASASVEVFAQMLPAPHNGVGFSVETLEFLDANSSPLNYFLLAPNNKILSCDSAITVSQTAAVAAITNLAVGDCSKAPFSPAFRTQQQFASRWSLRAADKKSSCLVVSKRTEDAFEIQSYDTRFDMARLLLMAFASSLVIGWCLSRFRSASWLVAGWLLCFPIWHSAVAAEFTSLVFGTTLGAVVAGLLMLFRAVCDRRRLKSNSSYRVSIQAAAVLFFLALSEAHGVDEIAEPVVVLPDNALPVVYAESEWLQELRDAAIPNREDALVADCRIQLTVLSRDSASIVVQCDVAVQPDLESELVLPLKGLTLVSCALDNEPVFPVRNTVGNTTILIPRSAVLPSIPVSEGTETESSDGPGVFGTSLIRTVTYTVRVAPARGVAGMQFVIPHPKSPKTRLEVVDPTEIASTARVGGAPAPALALELREKRATFPPSFYANAVDVTVMLRDGQFSGRELAKRCEVVCRADVSPWRVGMTCEYRFLPVDQVSQTVRIGGFRQFQITDVETLAGDRLPWSADGNDLVVPVGEKLQERPELIVRGVSDRTMSLQQSVPLSDVTTVNGKRVEVVTLLTATSGLFLVDAVQSSGTNLEEVTAATLADIPAGLRPSDRVIRVAPNISAVDVRLSRQQAAQDVSRLVQKAIVNDETIEWTCRCEIDITGQPAFRQSLRLSKDVEISSVTASNGEVSRLHSWHRNGDLITVKLREGIRGLLVVELQGRVKRKLKVDTSLPRIEFPIQPLISVLELSSVSESEVSISDFGGTRPNVPFDKDSAPIPQTPISFTVIEDASPLLLRPMPEQRMTVDATIVAYESNGHAFLAQYLDLKTDDAAFTVPVVLPQMAAFTTSELWTPAENGLQMFGPGESTPSIRLSSVDSESNTVVAVTEILMPNDSETLLVPLPDFGVELSINSVSAYDLRQGRDGTADNDLSELPEWVQVAGIQTIGEATGEFASVLDSRFEAGRRSIAIHIEPSEVSSEVNNSAEGIVLATADHLIHIEDSDLLTGTSGFLCFAMQDRQTIRVRFPDGAIATGLKIDGREWPFDVSSDGLSVFGQGRVCLVEVDWIWNIRADSNNSVLLPELIETRSSVLTTIVRDSESRWELGETGQDRVQAQRDRLRSLTTGLQLIQSRTLSVDQQAAESTPLQNDSLPTGPVWQKLFDESPAATQRFAEFLRLADAESTRSHSVANLPTNVITLTTSSAPSTVMGAIVFLAVVMFLTPLIGGERRRTAMAAEASTVISTPSSTDSEDPEKTEVTTLSLDS